MHLTKHVPHFLALILFTCCCGNSLQAQTINTYTDSFSGGSIRSQTDSKITFAGKAGAALPGYLTLTIAFNNTTNAIESGSWTLTITKQNGDQSFSETGRLVGTVSGGTVAFDQQGGVASVNDLRLAIKSGAGVYANIVAGNGTFSGAAQNVANTPPFTGTLTFNF